MRRRIAIWLIVPAAAACGLAGCGRSLRARDEPARASCPGARVCPYSQVEVIGRRGEGVLRSPEAIAVGAGGRVYVADQFGHTVQAFSENGRFELEWGSFGRGPGQFGAVGGLAVAPNGDVYVVDSTNDRVERFSADGRLIGSWGSPGAGPGQFDFGSGRGPDMPPGGGLAVGGSYVYVADTQNNRIERFSLDGSGARVLASPGTSPGQVSGPRGLAVSGQQLYVTDEGSDRVQELDLHGRFIAQTGTLSAFPAAFTNPFAVAVHGDTVYVADDNNGRIVELTRGLEYLGTLTGEGPHALSKFVRAVAVDAHGRAYVADTGDDRIEVFDRAGAVLRSWGSSGATRGEFVAPLGVAAASHGRLLAVETFGSRSPVYLLSTHLTVLETWRGGGEVVLGDHWFSPSSAAVAPDGSVWVTDQSNGLVRHLSARGEFLGALGEGVGTGSSGLPSAALSDPSGVALDAFGDVIVADTGHSRLAEFAPTGQLLASWSRPGSSRVPFRAPRAVAVGPDGAIYVVDAGNDRIVVLGMHGELLSAWGGRDASAGGLRDPSGVAVDADGQVFVSDALADRVEEFTPRGRLLASWGAEGTAPGELSGPAGVAVDCRGELVAADTRNNRLQVFTHVTATSACSAPPR